MNKEIKLKIDWLFWFILLLPTFYVWNGDLRKVQMNFFQLSVIALLALYHVNKWIGAFLIYSLAQFIFFDDIPKTSLIVQNIFFGALLYHFVAMYAPRLRSYLWAFLGLLGLNAFWCVLQMYQVDPLFSLVDYNLQTIMTEYPGLFSVPAFLGNFAAVCVPIAFALYWPILLVCGVTLFFSKSSFSVLAAFIAILFSLWFKKRILFWIALLGLGIFSAVFILKYDMPEGQFQKRFNVWNLLLKKSFQKQFFGHGIGSYGHPFTVAEAEGTGNLVIARDKRELLLFLINDPVISTSKELVGYIKSVNPFEYKERDLQDKLFGQSQADKKNYNIKIWDNPHNELIRVFFEQGIIGVFIVCGYFVSLFRRFFLVPVKPKFLICLASSTLAVIVTSLGHFPFYVARLAGLFTVILAMFELELLRSENASS